MTSTTSSAEKITSSASPGTRFLTLPVPDDCSDRYAAGWAYADWFVAKGGNLNADAPPEWHEEKVNGFWDRLVAERNVRSAPAPSP